MQNLGTNPTRRQTIRSLAAGGLVLPGLLSEMLKGASSGDPTNPLAAKDPHFAPKAKRVIFMFMTGGVSHLDTFDPKPFMRKKHGERYNKRSFYKGADWDFKRHGESGTPISDLFPHLGTVADDLCIVRSMKNINGDHFGATIGIHTGSATFNRPSIGSWVSYGLGTENQNLPSFMVIAPALPYAGGQVFGSDFLPVFHQGTRIVPGPEPDSQHASPRGHEPTTANRARHAGVFQPAALEGSRKRRPTERSDQVVRDGLWDANAGTRGLRFLEGIRCHPEALRD